MDVHFPSSNLCKVITLGEGQTPLSQDRCQLLLCRSTSIQKPNSLALVDYSKPESEKSNTSLLENFGHSSQEPPLLLIFYMK